MTGWIAAERRPARQETRWTPLVHLGERYHDGTCRDTWLELAEHPASCDDKDELEGDG